MEKEYGYTTEPLGTQTHHPQWECRCQLKDKLTSFVVKAITYDTIGNPLSYDGWSYTWEEGCQLKSLANRITKDRMIEKCESLSLKTE